MLAVTLLLGVVAFVALRGPSGSATPSGPLLRFEPARVVSLQLRRSDTDPPESIERVGDEWLVRVGATTWPASGQTLQAGLRVLASLEPDRPEPSPAGLEHAPTLTITLDQGPAQRLRIAPTPVGGLVLAIGSSDAPTGTGPARQAAGWVSADVHAMLVASGLRAWRDPAAIPGLGPSVWRIALRAGNADLELARQQGRWSIRSPIQAPADPEAVDRLVRHLASIIVADFRDSGAAPLSQEAASVEVESAERLEPGVPPRSVVRRLVVGAATDLGGRTVEARSEVERSGVPPESRVLAVLAQPLAELRADASAFVSRRSIDAPAADVGRIEVTACDGGSSSVVARTLDGWTLDDRPLTGDDLTLVQGLVLLLATAPSSRITVGDPAALVRPVCLRLSTIAGTPLAEATIGLNADGRVAVRVGAVTRVYTEPAAATAHAWLEARLAPR